jgi:hypothetical protein
MPMREKIQSGTPGAEKSYAHAPAKKPAKQGKR